MNRPTWTPEEFERLLVLPHDHPERVRAESSLEFPARARMLESFASLAEDSADASEHADAVQALGSRLGQALGLEIPAPPGTTLSLRPVPVPAPVPAPLTIPVPVPTTRARAPRASLWGWWFAPAARPALALAAVLVAVGLGWWGLRGGTVPNAVRDTAPPEAAFTLIAPLARAGSVTLSWTPAPGADSYRLVFYGDHLEELARLDGLSTTSAVLRADALPAGLVSKAEVEVEVQAIAGGDVLSRSRVRTLRLP